MRIVFLALSTLAIVSAVSLKKKLRPSHDVKAARRSQINLRHKIFAQQADFNYRIPKGDLTQEQKDQIFIDMGLGIVDANGDHKLSLDEALNQIPEEWRSPEWDEQIREEFKQVDTDNSGDVDMDEFIAYWRKIVEPLLDVYE